MTTELFAERYRIIRQVGEGGMGVVYEAKDELLKKTVAIKTIRRGFLQPEHIIRFQQEAKALAALNHPGLVPLYIFGLTDDNDPFMVMRFERGQTLGNQIEARGKLPLFKSLGIFIQIADAMKHAHEHGVLHRDLKPGNIMVSGSLERPTVIVLDFGVAMVNVDNAIDRLTKTGIIIGTPTYMSPEQVRGQEIDARSDIYSLGCIMYQALTGKPPLMAPTALELLSKKTSQSAPSLNRPDSEASFPAGIVEIVGRCLAIDVSDRYQSMSELKNDLLAFRAGDYVVQSETSQVTRTDDDTHDDSNIGTTKQVSKLAKIGIPIAAVLLAASISLIAYSVLQPTVPPTKIQSTQELPIKRLAASSVKKKSQIELSVKDHTGLPTKLEMVHVTKEEFFDWIRKNPRVHDITVGNSAVTGVGFDSLSQARRNYITRLHFIDCNLSQKGVEEIGRLPILRELVMTNVNLTAIDLSALAGLKELLQLSIFTSELKRGATIPGWKTLEKLYLNGVKEADDDLVAKIVEGSPNLTLISLERTSVTGKCINSFLNLKKLKVLNMRNQPLSDDDMKKLAKLSGLQVLEIERVTGVSERGLSQLTNLKNLHTLKIDSRMGSQEFQRQLKAHFKVVEVKELEEQIEAAIKGFEVP